MGLATHVIGNRRPAILEAGMHRRTQLRIVVSIVSLLAWLGSAQLLAQDKPLATGQPKVEVLVTAQLSEVGLAGTNVAQRVTIAPGTKMADHAHTGRTSLLIMVQGALTEVRGSVKHDYKTGDVIQVSEGATHHVENYGTVPAVYIEINTTAKK
jgi:quercetin dioxygenase-like cupin family protein